MATAAQPRQVSYRGKLARVRGEGELMRGTYHIASIDVVLFSTTVEQVEVLDVSGTSCAVPGSLRTESACA